MSEMARLIGEKARLEKRLQKLDLLVADSPEGWLIVKQGYKGADGQAKYKYFNKVDGKLKYIQKSDFETARKLAAKQLNCAVRKTIERELELVEYAIKNYSSSDEAVSEFYFNHPGSARLLRGAVPTIPDFVKKIIANYKTDNDYYPEGRTKLTTRGEKVRSKSEAEIANALFARDDLYYIYEAKIICDFDGKKHALHPDFLIINLLTGNVYIWDHCGMMDKEGYFEKVAFTNACYNADGFVCGKNLIQTFETKNNSLTEEEILAEIHRYFGA